MDRFYIKIFSLDGGVERHSVNTFSVRLSSNSVLTRSDLVLSQVFILLYRSVYSRSPHYQKVDFSSVQCILLHTSTVTLAGFYRNAVVQVA